MILPDDTPESPSKLRSNLPDQQQPPQVAPPAYPGHEISSTSAYRAGPSTEAQPILPLPVFAYTRPVSAKRRFCKAFGVAILIYLLAATFLGSLIDGGLRRGRSHREDKNSWTAQPLPGDGRVLSCLRGARGWTWENGKLSAKFELERSSDVLYLFKRGLKTSGNVVITQDERMHQDDLVHVDVVALPSTAGILHSESMHTGSPPSSYLYAISVCALERAPGQQGIGIFSPLKWDSRDPLPVMQFEITVRLPRHSNVAPLKIAAFESNLPNFSHHIRDLGEHVLFKSLDLKSTNAHIFSQSVNAINAAMETTNERIYGSYESSGSLALRTTNANINVTALLRNTGAQGAPPTTLTMKTSNGKLDASASLISTSPNHSGGTFSVDAATTNEHLTLNFPTAPVDSQQAVVAQTTNFKALVSMSPTFEGTTSVRTTNGVADVKNLHRTDPSGRNRERKVEVWCLGRSCEGQAAWNSEHMGGVTVRTTNANAVLRL